MYFFCIIEPSMNMEPEVEKELLERIANGDRQAFTTMFKHYHKYVYTAGRKLTHSSEMAEEVVQDIFLKIWLNREKLGDLQNFAAYLNRLVRNYSLNLLRQMAQHAKSVEILQRSEVDESTLEVLNHRETLKILDEALQALSPQQRKAYELCHLDGMRYSEAASAMNVSAETVHTHMKQALRKIRVHFRRYGMTYIMSVLFHIGLRN